MQSKLKGRQGWHMPPELAAELDKCISERSFESEVVRNRTLMKTATSLVTRYNARLLVTNTEAAARNAPRPNQARFGRPRLGKLLNCEIWTHGRNEETWAMYSSNIITAKEAAERYIPIKKPCVGKLSRSWATRFLKRSVCARQPPRRCILYVYMYKYVD